MRTLSRSTKFLCAAGSLLASFGCSNIENLQFEPAPGKGAPTVRADARRFDHSALDRLLKRYVAADGLVDYLSLRKNAQPQLLEYIASLATVDPAGLQGDNERKAYWINAYNAITLAGILHHYPTASIRDLGGFWDRVLTNCGGRNVTLNQIEHEILRPMGDPRIHVAINCASMSCPQLQREAYTAEKLDAQLDAASAQFLTDPTRNRFDADAKRGSLSKIFSWFGEDFDSAPYGGVRGFVRRHGPNLPWLADEFRYGFMDYDWGLNEDGS